MCIDTLFYPMGASYLSPPGHAERSRAAGMDVVVAHLTPCPRRAVWSCPAWPYLWATLRIRPLRCPFLSSFFPLRLPPLSASWPKPEAPRHIAFSPRFISVYKERPRRREASTMQLRASSGLPAGWSCLDTPPMQTRLVGLCAIEDS